MKKWDYNLANAYLLRMVADLFEDDSFTEEGHHIIQEIADNNYTKNYPSEKQFRKIISVYLSWDKDLIDEAVSEVKQKVN